MIRLLLACLAALLFASCLDYHEEVWLNADASGKGRIQISLPLHAVRMDGGEAGVKSLIEDYFKSTPIFTSYSVKTAVHREQLEIDISMEFENALNLSEMKNNPAYEDLSDAAGDLMGYIEIKFEGSDLHVKRQIDLTNSIPGSVLIPSDQLKGHKVTTIVHLPKAATSHNADAVGDSGKTLTWNTPLATALQQPIERSFVMPLPIPWMTISLVGIVIILSVTALVYWILRRTRASGLTRSI